MSELFFNDAETVSHTPSEFISRVTCLLEDSIADAFIRFVLTGEYRNDTGQRRQAFIDAFQSRVTRDHKLRISRDYDSLLGITQDFLVDASISVYSLPRGPSQFTHPPQITRYNYGLKYRNSSDCLHMSSMMFWEC